MISKDDFDPCPHLLPRVQRAAVCEICCGKVLDCVAVRYSVLHRVVVCYTGRRSILTEVCPEVVGSIPAKTPKTEDSNLHGFERHRPSRKGTRSLFQVIKAIINQSRIE